MLNQNKRMSRPIWIAIAVILMLLAGAVFFYLASSREPAFYIDPTDSQAVSIGEKIYVQHCVACHGKKLEGQPHWRTRLPNGRLPAPPHDETGHTWHHADILLFDIVKHGLVPGRTAPPGHESDMPAYGSILSDAEIIAVLAYIKSTWPEEVREMQREASQRHRHRHD